MIDTEILKELYDQRIWWENKIEESQYKLDEANNELSRVDRLIELLEQKIKENNDDSKN